jgi:hypothetical protein
MTKRTNPLPPQQPPLKQPEAPKVPAVNIAYTQEELEALLQVCDAALRGHGLQIVGQAQHIAGKALAARQHLAALAAQGEQGDKA